MRSDLHQDYLAGNLTLTRISVQKFSLKWISDLNVQT
jgi:hypothetical protein